MSKCSRTQRFDALAPANQRCSKKVQAVHLHPQREADAEEFGLDPLDVREFALTVGVDFTTAILLMDAARTLVG